MTYPGSPSWYLGNLKLEPSYLLLSPRKLWERMRNKARKEIWAHTCVQFFLLWLYETLQVFFSYTVNGNSVGGKQSRPPTATILPLTNQGKACPSNRRMRTFPMGSLTSFLLSSLLNIEETYLLLGFYFTFESKYCLDYLWRWAGFSVASRSSRTRSS